MTDETPDVVDVGAASPPDAPPVEEKPPTGHCTKCGAIVPLAQTFVPSVDGHGHGPTARLHKVGARGRIGNRELGEPCGPVAEAYAYHVFAWGPQGPLRDIQESSLPIDMSPAIAETVLAMWEANIRSGFTITAQGAPLVGAESKVRIVIQAWKLLGIR